MEREVSWLSLPIIEGRFDVQQTVKYIFVSRLCSLIIVQGQDVKLLPANMCWFLRLFLFPLLKTRVRSCNATFLSSLRVKTFCRFTAQADRSDARQKEKQEEQEQDAPKVSKSGWWWWWQQGRRQQNCRCRCKWAGC
jgi:hypothetical protein